MISADSRANHPRVEKDRFNDPSKIREVRITGRDLTIEEIVAVARYGAHVELDALAARAIERCRVVVEVILEQNAKVYGLTTGFGRLRDVPIAQRDVCTLQLNLIRSHACGVGDPFPEDVVRAATLLRVNMLALGYSGIRLAVVQQLINLLNNRIYPYVPCQGSVGASGDLIPLSHLVLVLIGDENGCVFDPARRRPADQFVRQATAADFIEPFRNGAGEIQRRFNWTFTPVKVLEAKEGLALTNGTQFMAALLALAVYDAWRLLQAAELAGAMSLEAQRGVPFAYREEIHAVRPLAHQMAVARRLLRYLEGSQILTYYLNSAYIARARKQLREAWQALNKQCGDLECSVAEPADRRRWVVERLRQHESDLHEAKLRALIEQAQSRLDSHPLHVESPMQSASDTEVRRQISVFRHLLRRIRWEVAVTYQEVQLPTFPPAGPAAEALAEAIRDLERAVPATPPVQDDYSFRCFPQVLACAYRALWHVYSIVQTEVNSATDNPLIFPPEPPDRSWGTNRYREWLRANSNGRTERLVQCLNGVIGGGNFHGAPLAVAADYLSVAMAEVANIAERRIAHLVDASVSNGLPGFLMNSTGLNSGLMIPQYTAAALVSENKVLAHPASVDSIPTSANAEDYVSMGTFAARKCTEIVENVAWVIAIELLTAFQALQFREPLQPGTIIGKAIARMMECGCQRYDADRVMFPDMHRMREILRSGVLHELIAQEVWQGDHYAGCSSG